MLRVNTKWLLDTLNSILVKFDLQHFIIAKDTKHQCYTLTYDIYKTVNVPSTNHAVSARNWRM